MKGLELSKAFYLAHGAPMLHEQFADTEHLIAVGLVGSGSECLGYDDELSLDHDFEPGFCLFLPDESVIDSRTAFRLERAYAKLPKEFGGFRRATCPPVGGNRHGVLRIEDFIRDRTGTPDGILTLPTWLSLPEQALLEATGGEVFRDELGLFTEIRRRLSYFPEDVRRKKLAGHLLLMGQSGSYNYCRCIARGEYEAAQMALYEFVKSALATAFLLNKRYLPYYKWSFRALLSLPTLSELYESLSFLLLGGADADTFEKKKKTIEQVLFLLCLHLKEQGLSDFEGCEAEGHAHAVNDGISDGTLRNLHILYAV